VRTPSLAAYYRTRWFWSWTLVFLGLWVIGKLTAAYAASLAGAPPFEFRPVTSVVACGFEMIAVSILLKRSGEYVLLTNLGLRPAHLRAPFIAFHLILDLTIGGLAR
jgi:hypothetical protein